VTRPDPGPGALMRLRERNRWGDVEPLAGLLVTVLRRQDLDAGLSDALAVHHAPADLLATYRRPRVEAFELDTELEPALEAERDCPVCGALCHGARVMPDGALFFPHDETGHLVEPEPEKETKPMGEKQENPDPVTLATAIMEWALFVTPEEQVRSVFEDGFAHTASYIAEKVRVARRSFWALYGMLDLEHRRRLVQLALERHAARES